MLIESLTECGTVDVTAAARVYRQQARGCRAPDQARQGARTLANSPTNSFRICRIALLRGEDRGYVQDGSGPTQLLNFLGRDRPQTCISNLKHETTHLCLLSRLRGCRQSSLRGESEVLGLVAGHERHSTLREANADMR